MPLHALGVAGVEAEAVLRIALRARLRPAVAFLLHLVDLGTGEQLAQALRVLRAELEDRILGEKPARRARRHRQRIGPQQLIDRLAAQRAERRLLAGGGAQQHSCSRQ